MSFEEDTDPHFRCKSANDQANKLKDLMTVCQKDLHHAQKLQKQAYDKIVKPRRYPGWQNLVE